MEDPGKNPDPPGAAGRIPGSTARNADLPSQNKKTPIPNRSPLHYDAAGSGSSNILEQCSINSISIKNYLLPKLNATATLHPPRPPMPPTKFFPDQMSQPREPDIGVVEAWVWQLEAVK